MSAKYVRDKVRVWAGEVTTTTTIPYYDTINLEESPTDNVWFTIGFGVDLISGTFCEPGYIENGFFTVMVFAQPGTGDAQAVTAIEQIVPEFMGKIDPSARLSLENYEPLRESSRGSAERFYRLEMAINYLHQL